jgi:DegV family protein with EDD domain
MENNKTAVITDSCSDLNDAQMMQYNIGMIPMRIIYKNGEYRDRTDITAQQVYNRLTEEIPKTSLPVPEDVLALYDKLADEGYTDAIHLTISSGLSGTYNMVRLLAESYERMRIQVIDTKTLSMHQGFIAMECANTLSVTQSIEKAKARIAQIREKGLTAFVIPTLEYLRKGGRIGLVEGTLGTLLRLKPVIYVDDSGVYRTLAKHPSFTLMIDTMVKEFVTRFKNKPVSLAVMHGSVQDEAQKLLAKLKDSLNAAESFLVQVTPVLGVHTGPGLLGIAACEK